MNIWLIEKMEINILKGTPLTHTKSHIQSHTYKRWDLLNKKVLYYSVLESFWNKLYKRKKDKSYFKKVNLTFIWDLQTPLKVKLLS